MSAKQQIDIVANWIMANCSEEIGYGGAGDVAVRLLDKYRSALMRILDELGVPDNSYPMAVANAYELAEGALVPNPLIPSIEELDEMRLRCPYKAEWEIFDCEPGMVTYSCTEHLNVMVSDTTVTIEAYANVGIVKDCCGYIAPCTE